MNFRFRLDSVLRYRERRRDECAAAVKDALTKLLAAREHQREQELKVRRLYAAVGRGTADNNSSVGIWRQQASYVAHARAECRRRERAVAAATEAWVESQQQLVEANRDYETLRQLEARQRNAWQTAQMRQQRRVTDEIASVRAARQRAAKSSATRLT